MLLVKNYCEPHSLLKKKGLMVKRVLNRAIIKPSKISLAPLHNMKTHKSPY